MASASSERPQSADVTSSDGGVAPTSDGELVAAVLAGRRQAFDELARRYSGALWRLAKSRLGSREAADDAVQETLLAAFRWLKGYDSRFSFRTWLWSILLNECRRSLAKRAKRRELTSGGDAAAQERIAELTADDNPARQAMASERAEL
ncbi:MAG TPA: RNA polymerase sigma factor, partial [Pirellulaceae bacterium]|nr:RNA polymerase sigma factor [Pirellulaceae bacterium]